MMLEQLSWYRKLVSGWGMASTCWEGRRVGRRVRDGPSKAVLLRDGPRLKQHATHPRALLPVLVLSMAPHRSTFSAAVQPALLQAASQSFLQVPNNTKLLPPCFYCST